MSRPPRRDHQPSTLRSRLRFNLRTMLALTALLAWALGWAQSQAVWAIVCLAALSLVEAGFVKQDNLLKVLVRNFFAFFVCSLAFAAVGFGLMHGSNPTGWFGEDRFLFNPLPKPALDTVDAFIHDFASLSVRADALRCTLAAVVAHRVMVERARPAAYLLLWLSIAGLVFPIFGSWTTGAGWLVRIECWGLRIHHVGLVAGWAALAGTLVLGRRSREERGLSLLSAGYDRLLVSLGLLLLWLLWGPLTMLVELISQYRAQHLTLATTLFYGGVYLAAAVSGLIGAAVASLVALRQLHVPLVLCGGVGGMCAMCGWALDVGFLPVVLTGLGTGALVVVSSWVFYRLRIDDPGGAVALYLVCALWGTLLTATLERHGLDAWKMRPVRATPHVVGIVASFLWIFPLSAGIFCLIRWLTRSPSEPQANATTGPGASSIPGDDPGDQPEG